MLLGYQTMPTADLLVATPVILRVPVETLVSRAGVRATCEDCGEEIINEREVKVDGRTLCRGCAGGGYFSSLELFQPAPMAAHAALVAVP